MFLWFYSNRTGPAVLQQNMLFVDLHVETSSYCLYKDHTFQFGGFT